MLWCWFYFVDDVFVDVVMVVFIFVMCFNFKVFKDGVFDNGYMVFFFISIDEYFFCYCLFF